jgi:threonine dehydratase
MVDIGLIETARRYLDGRIRRTPIEASPLLSERLGVPVLLKLECLQLTGSFKLRGAWLRLSRLDTAARGQGVVTCSAGNHGKAVAFAGRELGVATRIHVPASVDESKYAAMLRLGATVVRSDRPGYDETEALARADAAARGLPFISAFDDDDVIAGNGGSLGLELLEQAPDLATALVPVSGASLSGGLAAALAARRPDVRLVACQHRDSPSLALSLARGEAVTSMPAIDTLAGGIEGGIGRRGFALIKERVAHVFEASEDELYQAVTWTLDQHQLLIEPSAAVVVAACLSGRLPALPGPVVLVLSGRNLSLVSLRRVLARTSGGS